MYLDIHTFFSRSGQSRCLASAFPSRSVRRHGVFKQYELLGCSSAPRAINLVLNAGLLGCLLRLIFLGQTYLRSHGKGNLTPPALWLGPLTATLKNSPRQGEPGSGYLLHAGSDLTSPPVPPASGSSALLGAGSLSLSCSEPAVVPPRGSGERHVKWGVLPTYLCPANWVGNVSPGSSLSNCR